MESILATVGLELADGMMIPICAVLFALFISLIWRSLFAPMVALIEAREAATVGAETVASDAARRVEEMRREYEAKITDARVEAVTAKLEQLAKARAQGMALTQSAERAAADALQRAREDLVTTHARLRAECARNVDQLAEEIVRKILRPTSSVRETVSRRAQAGSRESGE